MNKNILKTIPMAISIAFLSACGGGGGGSDAAPQTKPAPKPTFYKIVGDSAQKVEVENQKQSKDWDFGFLRTNVLVNSGDAGAGNVQVALAAPQAEFYDEHGKANVQVFKDAIANSAAETAWTSVTDKNTIAALKYSAPKDAARIGKGWYSYDMDTHTVSPKPGIGYIVRSSTGDSYARMRIVSLKTTPARKVGSIEIEFAVQAAGQSVFGAPATKKYDLTSHQCIDFDTQTVVSCAGKDWDLQLKGFEFWVNSPITGGKGAVAFGSAMPLTGSKYALDKLTSGTAAPLNMASHYVSDAPAGVFESNSWYEYNLEKKHRIWPNYRVYVLRTGKTEAEYHYYKFQITSYYNEQGISGAHQFRVAEVK